jgi:hypothetical protein
MYAILRAKKIKTRAHITSASEHNLRLRTQSNIDPARTKLNRILFNPLDIDTKSASDFQEKLTEFYAGLHIKEKQHNVLLYEFVATASPAFFEGKTSEQIDKWASDQVRFMKKEFGRQLKFAVLHKDETSPHLHFFVSTELHSVKKYKNRYGECEKETWSLNSSRYDPNFFTQLQDRFAVANKSYGLKRGVRGSKRNNVTLKQFYKMVDRAMTTDYKQQIDTLIDKVELSVGDRLSIATIRDKFREYLQPYINQFAKQQKAIKELAKLDFKKLQETLITDQLKLKQEQEIVNARREVYAEAINSRSKEQSIDENMIAENTRLKQEIEELTTKYQKHMELAKKFMP